LVLKLLTVKFLEDHEFRLEENLVNEIRVEMNTIKEKMNSLKPKVKITKESLTVTKDISENLSGMSESVLPIVMKIGACG
jgi:predicted mannosyl-3-phosphoglycerate phosphatase (HAD superfamily)